MSFFSKLKLNKPFFVLFLIAFFVRGAVVLVKMDSFDADPDQYRALAENLREYGVFGNGETPTAFRPPLYPAVLRCFYMLTPGASSSPECSCGLLLSEKGATAFLHWILGVLTVLIVYKLALMLSFPRQWAFAAAFLVAADPILLAQSRVVMTETLAAFFAVLIIWCLTLAMMPRQKKGAFFLGIGLVAGLAALCRPVFLLFGLLVFLGLLNYCRMRKLLLRFALLFFAGFAAILLFWGVRNQVQMGKMIVTTTHGGYTLFLANNHSLYKYNRHPGPFAGPWNPEEFHQRWESIKAEDFEEYGFQPGAVGELRQDEIAYSSAHKDMSEDTQGAMIAAGVRLGHLWQFLPYQTDPNESVAKRICRWCVGLFYAAEVPLALFGFLYICAPLVSFARRRLLVSPYWSNWSWPVFLVIAVTLPHILYWANMRMRAPAMTVVPIFAVVGFRALISRKGGEPIAVGGPPTPETDEAETEQTS